MTVKFDWRFRFLLPFPCNFLSEATMNELFRTSFYHLNIKEQLIAREVYTSSLANEACFPLSVPLPCRMNISILFSITSGSSSSQARFRLSPAFVSFYSTLGVPPEVRYESAHVGKQWKEEKDPVPWSYHRGLGIFIHTRKPRQDWCISLHK